MKKWLFIFLVHSFQFAQAQFKYGIRFGTLVNNGSFTSNNLKVNSGSSVGAYVGAQFKALFEEPVFFAPQLSFSYKSSSFNINRSDTASLRTAQLQVHIAPLLQFDLHPKDKSGLFIVTGLSLYTTIIGKEKITKTNGTVLNQSMKFGYLGYDRFEAILNGGIGWENDKFFIQLIYNHGLSDTHNRDDGPVIKYRNISLGVGYFFGGKLSY